MTSSLQMRVLFVLGWFLLWIGTVAMSFTFSHDRVIELDVLVYPVTTMVLGIFAGSILFYLLPNIVSEEVLYESKLGFGTILVCLSLMLIPLIHVSSIDWIRNTFWAEIAASANAGYSVPLAIRLYWARSRK